MGWPTGWVCDLITTDRKPAPGRITRNDALRLAGNGVVPQQIIAGLQWLIPRHFGGDL